MCGYGLSAVGFKSDLVCPSAVCTGIGKGEPVGGLFAQIVDGCDAAVVESSMMCFTACGLVPGGSSETLELNFGCVTPAGNQFAAEPFTGLGPGFLLELPSSFAIGAMTFGDAPRERDLSLVKIFFIPFICLDIHPASFVSCCCGCCGRGFGAIALFDLTITFGTPAAWS